MSSMPAMPPWSNAACSHLRGYGRTILVILAWYAVSNVTILATKWLFTNHFPYPLTATCAFNATAGAWAAVITFCCYAGRQESEPLSRRALTRYLLPIGLCYAASIGCNNMALKILSVSFGTILKGSGPVFTFGWGLLFGLEQFGWPVAMCLLMMAFGIALASLGERSEFNLAGFVLALLAQSIGALGWALMHKLLLDEEGEEGATGAAADEEGRPRRRKKMPPLKAVLYTSPMIFLFVLPLALGLEGPSVARAEAVDSAGELLLIVGTMLFAGTLVFVLLMSEYWLLGATSSLGLSVASVLKELLTIGGGIFFFAERLDLLNVIGFVICQVGIVMYVKLRQGGGDGDGGDDNDDNVQDGENGRLYSSVDTAAGAERPHSPADVAAAAVGDEEE